MAIIHADTGDGFKRTVQASITRVTDHDQWSVTIQTEGIADSGEGIIRYRIALSVDEIIQLALFLPKNHLGALGDMAAHRANIDHKRIRAEVVQDIAEQERQLRAIGARGTGS